MTDDNAGRRYVQRFLGAGVSVIATITVAVLVFSLLAGDDVASDVFGLLVDAWLWIIDEPWRIVAFAALTIALVGVLVRLAVQDVDAYRQERADRRRWQRARSLRSDDI